MTIARRLPARHVWKCNVCGEEDIWQSSWSWYGSYLLEETCQEDLLTFCSDKCAKIGEEKINAGEIESGEVTQNYNDFLSG